MALQQTLQSVVVLSRTPPPSYHTNVSTSDVGTSSEKSGKNPSQVFVFSENPEKDCKGGNEPRESSLAERQPHPVDPMLQFMKFMTETQERQAAQHTRNQEAMFKQLALTQERSDRLLQVTNKLRRKISRGPRTGTTD